MSEPADAAAPTQPSKADLRLWARAVRSAARARQGAALDEAVCAAVRASDLYRRARTVAVYLAIRDEVDLQSLLSDDKRFVAPRTHLLPEPHLTFHPLAGAQLERRGLGVREPAAASPLVPLDEIDLVLVPGLAFDDAGVRLGYGMGYYDRVLAPRAGSAAPVTVGVTFDALRRRALPRDAHDVRVDYLVSESGLRPAAARP